MNDGLRLNRWAKVLGVAATSGLRCTVGPAIAARRARSAGARRLAALAVTGELVCDKLPRMANRTDPPRLSGPPPTAWASSGEARLPDDFAI